jgi:hypothetical protein
MYISAEILPCRQCCGSVTFLVQIRIRGSVPQTNGSGSGSGSCYFRQRPSRRQQTISKCFCLLRYFLKVHLHHFLKIKVIKKSQNSRNQGFSYYLLLDDRRILIRIWIRTSDQQIRSREAENHTVRIRIRMNIWAHRSGMFGLRRFSFHV